MEFLKKSHLLLLILLLAEITLAQKLPYKNTNLSPEARAKDLLFRMTLDEKLMQTQCIWSQKSLLLNNQGQFDSAKATSNFGHGLGEIARLSENKGPNSSGYHPAEGARLYNSIQRFFLEHTRLGIPVMVHEES